jgi:hypothetical protein
MDSAAIQKRLELLENAQNEYKIKKDMLQDSLRNDEELVALEDEAKEAKRKATAQKQALLNEPESRKVIADMKELAQDIKDTKALLGDELVAYFMANNTMEYIDPSGNKKRFRVSAQFLRGREES